jgi:hypothetical protein
MATAASSRMVIEMRSIVISYLGFIVPCKGSEKPSAKKQVKANFINNTTHPKNKTLLFSVEKQLHNGAKLWWQGTLQQRPCEPFHCKERAKTLLHTFAKRINGRIVGRNFAAQGAQRHYAVNIILSHTHFSSPCQKTL